MMSDDGDRTPAVRTKPEVDLRLAVIRYLAAQDAMHVVHNSTAVHNARPGMIAGAAMTPHCAWQCNILGAHVDEKIEWASAREDLDAILKA